MQRLTVAGRLLITVLILAAIFFAFRYFGGNDALKKLQSKDKEKEYTESQTMPRADDKTAEEATDESSASSSGSSDEASSSQPQKDFSYTAPEPQNGVLKGVVELGASGFNSFVVRIDDQKRWKLEKAEFGNSLVLENMATDNDVRTGLKSYIGKMLDFGVGGRNIHFVVSSGAVKAEGTQKIIKVLKSLNYFVNTVTPEQEGSLGLRAVLPDSYEGNSFVTDIGSGNTKISWKEGSSIKALETYGSKYYSEGTSDATVYDEVKAKAKQVPSDHRQTCFIIGGVPFELAKSVRKGKERYTVLDAPSAYKLESAKSKAGLNVYKAIADATGCNQFVFDWDANFTIGYLLILK
ncbi:MULTISPECIES: hypothetical protein [unclassified Spirosoma]|uniref:hypothetical protein n=1 Tax=unclassified Spirosoma TaxID=2621999 RepID=UPI000960F881|nr:MULTISPECIES: hypothetical protein [unclassified Spirosoma]MBN8826189.1 hypothetical protein [Spirosoma sp.]OJW76915.1 MAG: hypothetical protein BGO59_22070 [Spirosoma sp. 48-14]